MPFCKECGAEALADDIFCPQCGANLKETGTDKTKPKEGKPSRAEPDTLHDFIEECRNRGFSNAEIREELLKAGWKEGPINKALKPAVPKPVEPVVPKPAKKAEPAVPKPKEKEPAVPKPKGKKVIPEVPKPKAWPVKGEKTEPTIPKPKKKFWSVVGKILWWLLTLFYLGVGFSLFKWRAPPGLFAMFLAVLLSPPISKRYPKWLRISLAIFIFAYFVYFALR